MVLMRCQNQVDAIEGRLGIDHRLEDSLGVSQVQGVDQDSLVANRDQVPGVEHVGHADAVVGARGDGGPCGCWRWWFGCLGG